MLYVNIALSRQWGRMRSSRGNGTLAQLRRWCGLGPDRILRLHRRSEDDRTEEVKVQRTFLRALRPQRRVGVWWTLVRILHFIAFGFWVPTLLTAASWAVLSTTNMEIAVYMFVSCVYVFPVTGILACLGATSRFLDRENHYYPSNLTTSPQYTTKSKVDDVEWDPEAYEPQPLPPVARRRTANEMMSLADFLLDPKSAPSAPPYPQGDTKQEDRRPSNPSSKTHMDITDSGSDS